MQVLSNSFSPIKNIGSIVPIQEFAIYSDVEVVHSTTLNTTTTEQASIEIRELEVLLKEKLPQYHFTGSLEYGEELSIEHDRKVCHIHIFEENKLYYRYSTNFRDFWIARDCLDFFIFSPIILLLDLFFLLGHLFHYFHEEQALYIGQDVQRIIEEHDIELISYRKKDKSNA